MPPQRFKTFSLLSLAMMAFAGNSILCRLALAEGLIDAGSFTFLRLISGAVTLIALVKMLHPHLLLLPKPWRKSDLLAPLSLFGYALAFSFSYLEMDAGTGALILFACVQFTMIGYHLLTGNRMNGLEWSGLLISLSGFAYLLLPGASRPDILAALFMAFSGVCWAVFSIVGKKAGERPPILMMTTSFSLASLLSLSTLPFSFHIITLEGAVLAITSGAIASGLGYAVWYSVLPSLSIVKASVVQLSVPALASIGGWLVLGETLTFSTSIATLLVLGGIALIFTCRSIK